MAKGITCTCGHSWNKSDSSKKDMNVCHICGKDNTMKDGGWLDKYEPGGTVAASDNTRVATPVLKLTKQQLEKNKAINAQVLANTKKAKEAEVATRTAARNKPGKTVSEVFTNKDLYNIQERFRLFPGDTEYGQAFDEYFNPAYFTADMASNLGNTLQTGDYKGAATTAGLALGVGALGFDPLGKSINVAKATAPKIRTASLATMLNKSKLNTQLADNLYANRILEEELVAPNKSFEGFTPDLPDGDLITYKGENFLKKDGKMYFPMEYGKGSIRFADVTDQFAPRVDQLYPSKSKLQLQKKFGLSRAEPNEAAWTNQFFKPNRTVDDVDDWIIHNDFGKIPGNQTWWQKSQPYKAAAQRSLFDKPVGRHLFAKQSALESAVGRPLDTHRELMGNVIIEGDLPANSITITPTTEAALPGIQGLQSFNYNPITKSFERGIFVKKKNGGWLDKYEPGGPVQENYNDYSVSASEGFQGDGYSNVGRNYSPAWGGQFEDGGALPIAQGGTTLPNVNVKGKKKQPIIVTDKNDPRLKAYKDSLKIYNISNNKYKELKKDESSILADKSFKHPQWVRGDNTLGEYWEGYKGIKPTRMVIDTGRDNVGVIPLFKKPTQPVEYQERTYQTETPQLQPLPIQGMDANLPELQRVEGPSKWMRSFGNGADQNYWSKVDAYGMPLPGYTAPNQNAVVQPQGPGPEFAMGGSIPGAVGFTYARTGSIPSNGPYAKKTKASAQDGTTIYSGMLPEITVVGSKDPQTEEFYRNILNRLTKEEGYKNGIPSDDYVYDNPDGVDMVYNYPVATDNILGRYEGLMDLGKKYGFPKVHPVDKNSLLSKMATTVGGDARPPANYNASSKTIQADSTEDWVSEMAHHIQMKDNRLNKTIQWMKNDLPALAISEIMLGNRFGQYHIPGTVEHEAHSVIEPKLLEEMKKSENKYRQLPYRKKKTEEFYGALEDYQNGGEMKYYQEGLDFQPKTISRDGGWLSKYEEGGVIQDDMGQWSHPGEITEIGSNQITMQGVPYPVMGISDTGDTQMMYPNREYQYNGSSVTEYPMMADGGILDSVLNVGKGAINYVDNLIKTGINKLSEMDEPDPNIAIAAANAKSKRMKEEFMKERERLYPKSAYDKLFDLSQNHPKMAKFNKQLDRTEWNSDGYDIGYATDKNRIKLNTGRFTNANVSTKLIDDLAEAAKRNNMPIGQLLTLAGRESTFGEEKGKNFTYDDKNIYTSGWDVANDYKPYDVHRFLADKKVPGVKVIKSSRGYTYDFSDREKAEKYMNSHPELLEQYKKKLDSTPDIGNRNYFDLSAEFLKKKGIQGYNPGDPNYVSMFQKDYNTLKQDKALMTYLKKKGYKYEDGGELTKLDQLTNFSNYNTPTKGGWLDKYN